jgi:hypothetical protein
MMHIASRVIEPWQSATVAIVLFHLFHSAEITSSGMTCPLRRQAAPLMLCGQLIEMLADFLIERCVE